MTRNVRTPVLASLGCFFATFLLALAAYDFGPVQRLDLRTALHFEDAIPTAGSVADVLVHLGDVGALLVLAGGVVAIGLHFGRRREVLAALVVIAGANITTQVLKVVLEHDRNFYGSATGVHWTRVLPGGDSFPSGHTTAAASIAVAALFVVPAVHRINAAAIGMLLTAAVGISVVVLVWHYPTDVLGGMLVAAAWGFAALAALRMWPDRGGATDGATPAFPGAPMISND